MDVKTILSALGVLVLTGACATQRADSAHARPTDRSKAEAELRATDTAWSAAAGRKDVDAVCGYMANGGVTLAPNMPALRTKEEIRTGWTGLLGPGCSVAWKPVTVRVAESGELGYTTGTYTIDMPGGVHDKGKYAEVWTKVDGEWKCVLDMFNSDLPAR